jgi:hypothetical protein
MRMLRGFSLPKRADTPNEDRWACSEDMTACAVSDGASVSYDPGPWAEVLVNGFVSGIEPTLGWLDEAAAGYAVHYDRGSMNWMQEGAFDRGSFASLLGVRSDRQGRLTLTAVGDTTAILLSEDRVVLSFPYQEAESFDASPSLLCSLNVENRRFFEDLDTLPQLCLTTAAQAGDMLLIMTDALGHWALSRPELAFELAALSTEIEFKQWVEARWNDGSLRRDDCTLVVMG